MNLQADYKKLMEISTDYENLNKQFPEIKSKIIRSNENETILEEIVPIRIINKKFRQKSLHKKINPNKIIMNIISGPFKGTTIITIYEKIHTGTKVTVYGNFKTRFTYRLFNYFIKQRYKKNLIRILKQFDGLACMTGEKSWKDSIKEHGEVLILSSRKFSELKLYGWYDCGSSIEIFHNEAYSFLPVRGKTVIDVGSSNADSSIYFAINGARKVIAIEPYPMNYKVAEKNITANNLKNKITLVLAGCSNMQRKIKLDPNIRGNLAGLKEYNGGQDIPLFTLKDILEQYGIDSAVLKLDCETCEYDVILHSPKKILQKFTHIMLEYHKGYEEIKKRLEECNFNVKIQESTKDLGYLYAISNN